MKIEVPKSKQPMPKSAKRVFKGILFDVYHWEQELFDGSKATFEKLKRTGSVNIYPVTKDGKIILTRQEQPGLVRPFIGAVGGVIDRGESPLEAAKRELREESGIEADKFELWYSCQLSSVVDWPMYIFIARDLEVVGKPEMDGGEKIELVEYSFVDFLELVPKKEYRDIELKIKLYELEHTEGGIESLRKLFLEGNE